MTSEDRPQGDPRRKRAGSEATREYSGEDRRESPKETSGEEGNDDPRVSGDDERGAADIEPRPDGGTADVSLNISGHETERKRRGDDGVLSEFDVSDPDPDPDDDEVEPVELLVQLAEDDEINPWDIDVVRVTDKFLDRLDEADIRTGGRALFYASVLLRMKSDVLLEDDEPDDAPPEEPWETPPDEGIAVDPFDALEREMDRRIERKRARGMPRTLDELVRDLRERERETWWKESRTYDTSDSPDGFARGTQTLDYHAGDDFRMDDEPTAEDVTGTAHDEQMEDVIDDVRTALREQYDSGRAEVLFAEIESAGGSTVNTFLALLFLAHRGRIRLEQDELFGDLWVQDPAAAEPERAMADD